VVIVSRSVVSEPIVGQLTGRNRSTSFPPRLSRTVIRLIFSFQVGASVIDFRLVLVGTVSRRRAEQSVRQ